MDKLRIGLLGCGVVGSGVLRLLQDNAASIAETVGVPLEVARILVRDLNKARTAAPSRELLTGRVDDVLGDPTVDIVVEVMGGVDPARAYVERALSSGRSVVTANKMLLAVAGPDLIAKAQAARVDLSFEASVGGGIPVIRVLREALSGDRIASISGIVNGTCNFILTRMRKDGVSFEVALKEAQALGYAEAEPSLDVDGHDAAHKLVVLSMLAFGVRVDHAAVPTEGIRGIEPIDHRMADRFGFTIKHLALGEEVADRVQLRVHPALVRKETTLANVGGVLNAVAIEGRALGPCLLSGRGAGALPTAVSVVADIVDVALARRSGASGVKMRGIHLKHGVLVPIDDVEVRYYLRFIVYDRPGVLARITGALGDERVSIEQMVQEGGGDSQGAPVQVVILTHAAQEARVQAAMKRIASFDFVAQPARLLRIHDERTAAAN